MGLQLILQIRHDMDITHKNQLHNNENNYRQIMANLVEFRINKLDAIDILISFLENKSIWKLIIDL